MRENRNVPFRDWNIRVSRNHNGQLHICAVDICDILKRDELLENGAIARVCPTALKISFRKNGREQWGFRPIDMRRLLQLVRKETIIPRDLLDELEVWGNKLLELEAGERTPSRRTTSSCTSRKGPRHVPACRRQADVNATQITMHFGKIPSEWLRIASTDMLRREMAGNGHTGKYESQVFTTRGRGHGATWLESPLVIPLARWIAPDLSLAEWLGEAIGKLSVKRGKTIVRERPRVAAPGLPCMDCPMPQDMESATRLILELRKVVSESLPKIVFYEEFIENRDWFKSTRIADELGISPRQLHQFLAEEGICKYEKRRMGGLSFLPGLAMRCALHVGEQPGQGIYFRIHQTMDTGRTGVYHRTVAQEEP